MWKKVAVTLISAIAFSAPRIAIANGGGGGGDGGDGGSGDTGSMVVPGTPPQSFASMTDEQLRDLLEFAERMYHAGNGRLVDTSAYFDILDELHLRWVNPEEAIPAGGGTNGTSWSGSGDSTAATTPDPATEQQTQIDKAVEEALRNPSARAAIEQFGSPEVQAALNDALTNQASTPATATR